MECTGVSSAPGAAAHIIAEPQPPACSRGKDTWSGESGGQAQTSLGRVTGSNARPARGYALRSVSLLRRSLFLHRGATRCSARLDRSGVATSSNDERPPFKGPSRTESHRRWRSTPSPCSRLLSHDLTHVRPPLRLSFTLISNAMGCTGASRHLGRPHTLSQSLNHQLANGGKDTGSGESGRQAQTSLGRVSGSNVRLAPASLTPPPPRTGAGMAMGMTVGTRRGKRKGR